MKPEDNTLPKNAYNTWRGFKYPYKKIDSPAPGFSEALFKKRLYRLAGNDDTKKDRDITDRVAKFIFNWIVHMIQKPFEKPNCALAFRSEEGVGKSTFWKHISDMIGNHLSLTTSSISNIAGQFNGLIEGKLLIRSEEAFSYAKMVETNVMKDLITCDTVVINEKGLSQRIVKNSSRIICMSNNDVSVRLGEGDKHYIVMECDSKNAMTSDEYHEFTNYFKEYEQDIFNWLANHKMDVEVTDRGLLPYTPAKEDLILKTMTAPIKFIIDLYKSLHTDEKIQFFTRETVEIRSEEIHGMYKILRLRWI